MLDAFRRLALLPLLLLAACAVTTETPRSSVDLLTGSQQLVVVRTAGWDAPRGTLRRYQREDGEWREVDAAIPVTVGRAGAGWGLGLHPSQPQGPQKREGDGRSPAGLFAIGPAFGYPGRVETGLDYLPMEASHWCVDVSGSPLYNRIVDSGQVGPAAVKDSTEPMRRDLHAYGDQRYRLGFVVEHNTGAVPMAGSCIFVHVWKSPADATAGCTAMSDADMQGLLGWLRKDRTPRFLLLPEAEYERLRLAWRLP